MTRKAAIPKDPFHEPEPQVSNVYVGTPPSVLRDFDQAKGGINVPPVVITDNEFDSDFAPPPVPDLDFAKKRRK